VSWEVVIGLEVHCQLRTRSKLFSASPVAFGEEPNHSVTPLDLALPGTLPVLNGAAVELAIRAALATHCTVHERSIFARKNYFYPDLPKGYQISQYEEPLATGGWIEIESADGATRRVRLTRIHMEEDAGKSIHDGSARDTLIDLNRAGVPLIEIVSPICDRRRTRRSTCASCARSCARWAPPTRTWRRGSFAATRTSRSAGPATRSSARARRSRTSTPSASSRRRSSAKCGGRRGSSKTAARWCRRRSATTPSEISSA
jgi:hypothetical protein